MATTQTSKLQPPIAAAMGEWGGPHSSHAMIHVCVWASRLDTRDHLATLAGKELALGIRTAGPRSRIAAHGLSAHAYRAEMRRAAE